MSNLDNGQLPTSLEEVEAVGQIILVSFFVFGGFVEARVTYGHCGNRTSAQGLARMRLK
jgi:hypothetical protein